MKSSWKSPVAALSSIILALTISVFAAPSASAHADWCGHGSQSIGWWSAHKMEFRRSYSNLYGNIHYHDYAHYTRSNPWASWVYTGEYRGVQCPRHW